MPFANKVEKIPPAFSHDEHILNQGISSTKLQRQKWMVLIATFLLVITLSLLWVWTRPAIYQSKAIIHVSYPQNIGQELALVPVEQITLNQQRLTSFRVLQKISEQLLENQRINLDLEALSSMLQAKVDTESRTINLFAHGHESGLLKPVLEAWISIYLALQETETNQNTVDDISDLEQKIVALEAKVTQQRATLERYSEENNIVSLERDENRELNKIKGLSASLDQAEQEEVSALTELENARQTVTAGKLVLHPDDQERFAQSRRQITSLQSELSRISERYTAEYMALDPEIVRKSNNLELAKQQIERFAERSQARYLEELERRLAIAKSHQQKFSIQLDELNIRAKEFSQKLDQYQRLRRSLQQLESQSQSLKDLLIEKEVSKPFEATLNVLESPFTPSFPVGPNYWLNSLFCIAASAVASLLALLIFSFIAGSRQPEKVFTSFTMAPSAAGHLSHLDHSNEQLRQQNKSLDFNAQPNDKEPLLPLSNCDVQKLYEVSNSQAKLVIGLILHGIGPSDLFSLKKDQLDPQSQLLRTSDNRTVWLVDELAEKLFSFAENSPGELVWPEALTGEDVSHLLANAAHDAGIQFPEKVSADAIRHTYLAFLVSKGVKLNDLEKLAGYINPSQLAKYRALHRQNESLEQDEFTHIYTMQW